LSSIGVQESAALNLTVLQVRPDQATLFEAVIEGLGLPWPKETTSMFFGNWKWEWPEVDWKRWKEIQPTLKERVKKLLEQGLIRYGSW